jgi:hypothetical protein
MDDAVLGDTPTDAPHGDISLPHVRSTTAVLQVALARERALSLVPGAC